MSRLTPYFVLLLTLLLPTSALAQLPIFVTQTPIAGNSGNDLFVFLPVANIGSGAATEMQLTSVTLTHLGSPVATVIQPATLPTVTGSGYLGPGGARQLDLEFNNSALVSGNTYMIKVAGTYQVNGTTYGFALNRPVLYTTHVTATHEQTLDMIGLKFDSLPGIDRLADNQELLKFLSGLPQISAAGLGDPPSTVWAVFADNGERVVILNNFELPAVPPSQPVFNNIAPLSVLNFNGPALPSNSFLQSSIAAAPTSTSPTEFPRSSQVRLLNALSPAFANPVPELHSWLVLKQGYIDANGAAATVEALRNVGGDGVLYFNSHAGVDKKGNYPFNIWTTTPTRNYKDLDVSDPLQAALKDDIDNKRVIDVEAADHQNFLTRNWVSVHHYAITAEFVNKYWTTFGDNALVYIDACDSDFNDPSVQNFKDALYAKLASVYVGWTDEVGTQFSANAAKLVFDRLLGADQFCPEDGQPCHPGAAQPPAFAQRAFDYTQVAVDLSNHGLNQNRAATIKFEPNPHIITNFGLLAPSIALMSVDDSLDPPQLFITGSFGSDLGTVTAGGVQLGNVGWTSHFLQADLPPDLAGDVFVTVRGHKSNVARLTKWVGDFTTKSIGLGSLQQNLNFHLAFREDIRQYRPVIHQPPVEPTFLSAIFAVSPESTATFSCSGTATTTSFHETDTYTWSGSANLVPATVKIGSAKNFFVLIAAFLQSHTQMNISDLGVNSGFDPCTQNDHVVVSNPPNPPTEFDVTRNISICFPDQVFALQLDEAARIQNGSRPLRANQCGWPTGFSQGTLRWASIPAMGGTAPDPSSAR